MKNKLLALFLSENIDKNQIISEIFKIFNINCIGRCVGNPSTLDNLIQEFYKADGCDLSLLEEIIALIRETQHEARLKEEGLINKILAYIEKTYAEDLTIEEIANNLHISYYYMCHLFKEKCDIPITTFRNQKKLEKSMKMLLQTDMKISDIATACGYNTTSYYTEVFTKNVGISPTKFRAEYADLIVHDFYGFNDILFAMIVNQKRFMANSVTNVKDISQSFCVTAPGKDFHFLHETAIIEYHGVLYASWYACPEYELSGYTPICGRRSYDKGKTWTNTEIICSDETGKIMYCPPVYGICDDKLYMLINQVVAPDHMHSMDLYVLNPETDRFEFVWSKPIPFKLNTNVVTLPNGKLMLCGRIAKMDGFPNTPAVLISDNGKIDSDWRLVKIAENGDLPGDTSLIHPEISCMLVNGRIYMFCRNDRRKVPLVYISDDCGETWSELYSHDVPFVDSKVYCGNLSDGRCYLVGNTDRTNRSKLSVFFTDANSETFTKRIDLLDIDTEIWGAIHYPSACAYDNHLYIIATKAYDNDENQRGAELFRIDLNKV